MINKVFKEAEKRMEKAVEACSAEFSKIRTGRAHPSLLDHVMVPYYGNDTLLKHVATISVTDSRTLSIQPFEKQLTAAIEKAILTSGLGLNPANSGDAIRVPLPALTEERRKELTKLVRAAAEQARVSIRNVRRDANTEFKDLLKDKAITEDDERQGETRIQKLTDDQIKKIDELAQQKEAELMVV